MYGPQCVFRAFSARAIIGLRPRALPWAFTFRAFGAENLSFQTVAHSTSLLILSSEEDGTRVRPVDLDVTVCAVAVLRIQIMLWAGWLDCSNVVGNAVTGQTELWHSAGRQQARISRTVRRMTCATSFGLHRRMFESEWTLLVRVTLHAGRISAGSQSCLF